MQLQQRSDGRASLGIHDILAHTSPQRATSRCCGLSKHGAPTPVFSAKPALLLLRSGRRWYSATA